MKKYILAIDQGTTGTTVMIINKTGMVVSRAYREITQIYLNPGWVEHDPMEIWAVTLSTATQAMSQANISSEEIKSIGISNQRETTIVWDKITGTPITNAIVWQCRRSASICEDLKKNGWNQYIKEKTGLLIDAYFSASKITWILDNIPDARKKAEDGILLFGTVDTWLLWRLSGGQVHLSDYSNASRTMLYNIHSLEWDKEIIQHLNIPTTMLPQVCSSSKIYAYTEPHLLGAEIAISGMAGDQQAALFGQTCFQPGTGKNTYGTGCFLLMNTGDKTINSQHGLLTTIAWGINDQITYALEGSIFIAGAAVQWLRDELGIIQHASETEALAQTIPDNQGVYLVPAFVGMGAPYWNMDARGILTGLTRGTGKAHLARAVLESIAFQTYDVVQAMIDDADINLEVLNVDGGASANKFLMQFQADLLGTIVKRPLVTDSTALGAAYLAGLGSKYWSSQEELIAMRKIDQCFQPKIDQTKRENLIIAWKKAVKKALD